MHGIVHDLSLVGWQITASVNYVAGIQSVIELSKYTLDTLRNDKEVNLYRGWSEDDNSQILVLSPRAEYPAPEILKRLEHEYSLREELDSAWAARPIEIARHWDRTVLVLEDPGGVPLDQLLGEQLNLAFSLRGGGWPFRRD